MRAVLCRVAPASGWRAANRNLVVILFSYVVVTGQLPMDLMPIGITILLGNKIPVKIKQNCELCVTIVSCVAGFPFYPAS